MVKRPARARAPRGALRGTALGAILVACRADLRSGGRIYLETHAGRTLDVDKSEVRAGLVAHRPSQELTIANAAGGRIRCGDVVFLRARTGRYLDVDGVRVEARWDSRGRWQELIIETRGAEGGPVHSGDTVFLRAHTGKYIDVEGDVVRARWPDQGPWQSFIIHDKDAETSSEDLFHGALDVIGAGCGFVNLPQAAAGLPALGGVTCHKPLETDCTSVTKLARACPPACPYVAPHPQLSCVYQCTIGAECSAANPEVAYANNATSVCEPCEVVGCRRCVSPHVCAECFNNFWLELGGRACLYVWDARAQHGVHSAAALVLSLAILVSVVLVAVDFCACCGRCLPQEVPDAGPDAESEDLSTGGPVRLPHLEESATSKAIRQGKLHRGRSKVRCPKGMAPEPQAAGDQTLPVCLDLRSEFLTGVGMPLFHQWYRFLLMYSVLMTAGTFWVYHFSELDSVQQKSGIGHASDVLHGRDAMALCGLRGRNDDQLGHAIRAFATRAAGVYFLLWVVGFGLSVAHALRQKRVAADFYRKHPCLAEFALNVEGFPPDATDETRIRKFLREAFSTEALEVSVCYDYRHLRRRVHELLEKVLVEADVRAGTYEPGLAAPTARLRHGLGLSQEERSEILSWMRPASGGLRNAGHVFVVFPHNYDLHSCRQRFEASCPSGGRALPPAPVLPHEDTPRWLSRDARPLFWVGSDGKMHELVIRDVVCEPPDVVWENLGTEVPRLVVGHIVAGLTIIGSFVAMTLVIFVPLASYSINYMLQAGSLPTGIMMSVMGSLVMAGNWVMCQVHSKVSSFVGFVRRDREGLLLFKVFAVLCLVNFLFNVSIALFPDSQAHALRYVLHPLRGSLVTMQSVAFQARISAHFFHVLVPGGLFIGYLLWPLQGFLWPFVSSMVWLRCRYRGARFVPARVVELALEPLGISVAHDYMGHIVQPTACTLMLFFASDAAWQTFACLVCWSVFMVPFMRYLHLRQVRRCYLTTNRLDTDVLFMWGLPLSMVLAASCFWAAQVFDVSLYLVPLAWAGGMFLYALVLAHWVRPLIPPKSEGHACHRPSYAEVRAMRKYDWHNCNPIKVLLSQCAEQAAEARVPFAVGKEYLQAEEAIPARPKRNSSPRHGLGRLGGDGLDSPDADASECAWGFIPSFPEVEALINAPLDAIGALGARVAPEPTEGGEYSVVASCPEASDMESRTPPASRWAWPPESEDEPPGLGSPSCAMPADASAWPAGYPPL